MSRQVRTEPLPTLADRWSPRRNSFALLRLVLAFGVLIAHCWPVGYARASLGNSLSRGQTDLGSLSLFGLLVVSGFLNTDSGLRKTGRQFAWRRFLRIFPGLWVCLLVTALVFAPAVALYENGTLHGFWTHGNGPLAYLATNWFGSMQQFSISGLLAHTPYGVAVGGPSAFDGSLWSVHYELGCYIALGVLIATNGLRRRPWTVLLALAVAYLLILRDTFGAGWTTRPVPWGAIGPIPLLGSFAAQWVLYLGFLFLLGAAARLYMGRIPMHGALAVVAGVLILATCRFGAFLAIGLLAYAYLLLYVVVALPGALTRVGRTRDYSYGVYIYAFPVQQMIALTGGTRHGMTVYILLSIAGTFPLAVLSWHLVEHPALSLKDWKPGRSVLAGRTRPGLAGARVL